MANFQVQLVLVRSLTNWTMKLSCNRHLLQDPKNNKQKVNHLHVDVMAHDENGVAHEKNTWHVELTLANA